MQATCIQPRQSHHPSQQAQFLTCNFQLPLLRGLCSDLKEQNNSTSTLVMPAAQGHVSNWSYLVLAQYVSRVSRI